MQESIIVYSNPFEKALWEGNYAGQIVPIFSACIVFLFVFLICFRVYETLKKHKIVKYNYKTERFMVYPFIIISSICAVFTCWYMWI